MKKIYLLTSLALFTISTQAQIIFNVESPSSIAGEYDFSPAGTDWTLAPDMTIPGNAILDTLMLVDDGTADDTLSCNPLINDLTGKIAVLYRGACQFGVKAINAENAGAIGVIIINIAPGTVGMGAGTDGPNVTIPVWMISSDDGAAIRAQMDAGDVVVFYGTKNGLYSDDLGFNQEHMLRAPNAATPQILAQDSTEFSVEVGTWVYNFGNDVQTGVGINVDITFGGANIYSEATDTITMLSGDSIYLTLPTFKQASYPVGYYGMDYTLIMDSTDEYMSDNQRSSDFSITDTIFSYCGMDSTTAMPTGGNARRSVGLDLTDEQRFCVHFKNPNASRIGVTGITFAGATSPISGIPLDGEYVEGHAYSWDDSFTGISDANFNISLLTQLTVGEYTYSSDLQNQNVELNFYDNILLEDNQRYLFCIIVYSASFQIPTNVTMDYNENMNLYDEAHSPVYGTDANSAATWFGGGFGTNAMPRMAIRMLDSASIIALSVDEPISTKADIVPFPNPTRNVLNIPFGNNTDVNSIEIYDITGKLISTQAVSVIKNGLITVDMMNVSNGTYVFKATYKDGSISSFNVVVNK